MSAAIGRLTAMTGERLPPKRGQAAVAVAAGEIAGHHRGPQPGRVMPDAWGPAYLPSPVETALAARLAASA